MFHEFYKGGAERDQKKRSFLVLQRSEMRVEILGQFTCQCLTELLILLFEFFRQLIRLLTDLSHHLFTLLNQCSLLLSAVFDHLLQI